MYQSFNPCMDYMPNPMVNPYASMKKIRLTRAFIPDQPYISLFPLDEALKKGTLFPNLYIPYPIKSKE